MLLAIVNGCGLFPNIYGDRMQNLIMDCTPEELQSFYHLIDLNGDGFVSIDEFIAAVNNPSNAHTPSFVGILTLLGMPRDCTTDASRQEFLGAFHCMDRDCSGSISKTEFFAYVRLCRKWAPFFKSIDCNNDNSLTKNEFKEAINNERIELRELIEAIGLPPVVEDAGATRRIFLGIFDAIDIDQSETISLQEFLGYVIDVMAWGELFKKIDINGDHRIELREFMTFVRNIDNWQNPCLRPVLQSIGITRAMLNERVNTKDRDRKLCAIFAAMDTDNSNALSLDEFIDSLMKIKCERRRQDVNSLQIHPEIFSTSHVDIFHVDYVFHTLNTDESDYLCYNDMVRQIRKKEDGAELRNILKVTGDPAEYSGLRTTDGKVSEEDFRQFFLHRLTVQRAQDEAVTADAHLPGPPVVHNDLPPVPPTHIDDIPPVPLVDVVREGAGRTAASRLGYLGRFVQTLANFTAACPVNPTSKFARIDDLFKQIGGGRQAVTRGDLKAALRDSGYVSHTLGLPHNATKEQIDKLLSDITRSSSGTATQADFRRYFSKHY